MSQSPRIRSSSRVLSMTLVAVEVTSPETIVVARRYEPPYSIPTITCHEPPVRARVGEEIGITIEIEGNEMPYYGKPTNYFDINIEDDFPTNPALQARRVPINQVGLSVKRGRYWNLEGPSGGILDLSRIKLDDVAINAAGHYHLHLVIHSKARGDVWEPVMKIISPKVEVYDPPPRNMQYVSAKTCRDRDQSRNGHSRRN
ncbi:hypothetical protein F5Y04DRAFT_278019 [Hypomontagnella monticulosa]|nr:hypothetical protein F5Y04DRAFT_278019 [Hypomontagnella monticulosa]